MNPDCKFLVVVFDGLRPDHVTDARMPNLSSLKRAGCWLRNHRASFPTETRVNAASLATGAHCDAHGIVGNRFVERSHDPSRLIDGGDLANLLAISDRAALTATAYAERIWDHGLSMMSAGSQSSGAWGLSHPTREAPGHLGYWCQDATRFSSHPTVASLAERHGGVLEKPVPAAVSCKRVADVFLDIVASDALPALSFVWFSEPDDTYHNYGLGSPDAEAALWEADRQFGRLLDWWDTHRRAENLQLIVASDHGHITVSEPISVQRSLRNAGFSVGSALSAGCDIALTGGRLGEIWVRDSDPVMTLDVLQALREQRWFGLAFSPKAEGHAGRVPGTFSHDSVFAAHPRAPDLRVTFADNDDENAFGVPGCGFSDGNYPAGNSMHGGLHPRELGSVGLCAGSLFKEAHRADTQSSIVDLAPTILHALSIDPPDTMTGRVLHEVLATGGAAPQSAPATLSMTDGTRRSEIRRTRVGDHLYLDGAAVVVDQDEINPWMDS